jgi:IS5 family transposase
MPSLAALHLLEPHAGRPDAITVGADKGFDAQDFVAELREINVTPHVAQNTNGRRSAIDGRTTRHPGYDVSLRIRKRIEEAFGWAKTVAGLRKARHRGLPKIDWQFTFAMAAYNLVRCRSFWERSRDARSLSRPPRCLPKRFFR